MLEDISRKEILHVDIVPCNKRDVIATVTRISAINMPNVIVTIVITSLCHYYYYYYYHSHNVYTPWGGGEEHGCLRSNISTRIAVAATIAIVRTFVGDENKKGRENIEAWIHARVHARRKEPHQHWPGDRQSGGRKYGGDGVMMMVAMVVVVVVMVDTFV